MLIPPRQYVLREVLARPLRRSKSLGRKAAGEGFAPRKSNLSPQATVAIAVAVVALTVLSSFGLGSFAVPKTPAVSPTLHTARAATQGHAGPTPPFVPGADRGVTPSGSVKTPLAPLPTASVASSELRDVGATELKAAQTSLRSGTGPAMGVPQSCVDEVLGVSASCSTLPGAPLGTQRFAAAAAPPNPSFDLGWQVQGVPINRAYSTELMTWDASDGYVLLFGGSNLTTYLGDTWTYLHGVWTQITPTISPPARDSSSMVYDAFDAYVVLFGGYSPGAGGVLNDTWIFHSGTWQYLPYASTHGPTPRNAPVMTYDAATSYVLLWGGHAAPCNGVPGSYADCNDTWRFWFGGWNQMKPMKAPPPAREEAAITYDAGDGYPVMFGGLGPQGIVSAGGLYGDTWIWNASGVGVVGNWTQIKAGGVLCGSQAQGKCAPGTAPGERNEVQFAFDYADNETILFGGANASMGNGGGDTWVYKAGIWTRLSPAVGAYGRWGAPTAFDGADNYLMMWGGGTVYYTPVDSVWVFSGGNWSELQPGLGPPWSHGASMAWDALDGYVVYFGGYSGLTGFQQQTWIYNSGGWLQVQLNSFQQPSARERSAMTWDATDGYVLLFGGLSSSFTELNDTWAYVHGVWTLLCAGAGFKCGLFATYSPPGREAAGIAFNPNDGWPELFGGYTGFSFLNDTWLWSFGSWLNFSSVTPKAPATRGFFGMTWDAVDHEIVLFGGGNYTRTWGDTWTLKSLLSAPIGWAQVGSCGGLGQSSCPGNVPSPRAGFILVYDGADQVVVAAGGLSGWSGGNYQAYSYVFKGGNWSFCTGYFCFMGYGGWVPYIAYTTAAYDPLDGYVAVRGGNVPFGQYDGSSYLRDTLVWGHLITGQSPTLSPSQLDAGQTGTFTAYGAGGGFGTLSYGWNGIPQGCAPGVPGAAMFSCAVTQPGLTQYGSGGVYGSYFIPSTVITDSNGFPGITTYQGYLPLAPDPSVFINSSATTADVGQVVYYGLTGYNGWQPYSFYWNGMPPGCAVVNTTVSTQLVNCTLGANAIGSWLPDAGLTDSQSYSVFSTSLSLVVSPSPTATGVSVTSVALDAGQTLSVGVNPSGGSGGYMFTWSGVPAACLANAAVLSCSVPGSEVGPYVPAVTIRDSNGGSFFESYAGTVVVSPSPTATSLSVTNSSNDPTSAIDQGQSVTFSVTSTVGSGKDTIVWTGLPAGCTASTTNSTTIACTPSRPGDYVVSTKVTDSNGGSVMSPSASLSISPALAGAAIAASTVALEIGQSLTLAATFSGGSGGDSFSWMGLPSGCVTANSASLVCAPTAVGSYNISVRVTDSNGMTVAAPAVGLSVAAAPAPASAPFATSFEWLELGLLVVLILLALAAVIFAMRRPPSRGPSPGPPPAPVPPPTLPPPGAAGSQPEYIES